MKKIVLLALVSVSLFMVSCKKDAKCPYSDSNIVATQAETDSIQRYLTANSITAVQHPSGLWYTIGLPGSGTTPEVCSDLTVQYAGYLFNGTFFDGTTGSNVATFTLGQTIEGWKKAMPLIKPGGTLTMYLPPSLGYGGQDVYSNGVLTIPANSYLKFTVTLRAVQ